MLPVNIVPARNLQKSYKSIIESVKAKKHFVILTTNDQPQAAIVSLDDLEELKRVKFKQAALDMLALATEHREELKGLPADLREKADALLYSR